MTSGAQRLKANLDRSFGSRKKRKDSQKRRSGGVIDLRQSNGAMIMQHERSRSESKWHLFHKPPQELTRKQSIVLFRICLLSSFAVAFIDYVVWCRWGLAVFALSFLCRYQLPYRMHGWPHVGVYSLGWDFWLSFWAFWGITSGRGFASVDRRRGSGLRSHS